MKKIKFDAVILTLLFALITILSLFFFSYLAQSYRLEVQSRGLYGKQTRYFTCNTEKITHKSLRRSIKNAVLYAEVDINEEIRTVYVQGDIVPPELTSGRFFSPADFEQGRKTAVLGMDYEARLTQRNGKQVFSYQGEEYEVIGILGCGRPSRLDRIALLSYHDGVLSGREPVVFALDAKSKKDAEQSMRAFSGADVQFIERERKSAGSFIQQEWVGVLLFLLSAAFFVCTTLVVSLYWTEHRRTQIAVMRLVGHPDSVIRRYILTRFALLSLTGFGLGSALGILLLHVFHYAPISAPILLPVYLFIVLCFGASVRLPLRKALSYSVISVLR